MNCKSTTTFENDRVTIGQYYCWPESSLWSQENQIGDRAEMVFPRRAVSIHQAQMPATVASPNDVVFYDAFNYYRRKAVDPRGDLCDVFAIEPETMEEIALVANLPTTRSPSRTFANAYAPCSSKNYLWQRALFLHVRTSKSLDPVFVEESILAIASEVLGDAAKFYRKREKGKHKNPSAKNRELVEAVSEFISLNHRQPLTLDQLAQCVDCSVFHLCHVFRAIKGVSVYQYLLRYRLRAAIEFVLDDQSKRRLLNRLAFDYCFSSHSHFTSSFCRQFGLTPSQLRAIRTRALLDQLKSG